MKITRFVLTIEVIETITVTIIREGAACSERQPDPPPDPQGSGAASNAALPDAGFRGLPPGNPHLPDAG